MGAATEAANLRQGPRRDLYRCPETWKKNVAKMKRAKGEEYVSPASGKLVPSRKTGRPCGCKHYRCFNLLKKRKLSSKILISWVDKEPQDAHLFGLIHPGDVKNAGLDAAVEGLGERASLTQVNICPFMKKSSFVQCQMKKGSDDSCLGFVGRVQHTPSLALQNSNSIEHLTLSCITYTPQSRSFCNCSDVCVFEHFRLHRVLQ